jgi:hypothetical protein
VARPAAARTVAVRDDYLEFIEGRCRPNTVLAAASDLRVLFGVVEKPPAEVVPADVLGFITAQRTGRTDDQRLQRVDSDEQRGGVATSTVARRFVDRFGVLRLSAGPR